MTDFVYQNFDTLFALGLIGYKANPVIKLVEEYLNKLFVILYYNKMLTRSLSYTQTDVLTIHKLL